MVDSARMLDLDDKRWNNLTGGYRIQFDPRPLLAKLETGSETAVTWHDLWEELHHQGDVGDASYAAIPHLVRIHQKRGVVDWNTYAIVAIIELARTEQENPEIPKWMVEDYFRSIGELAEIGATQVLLTKESEAVRAILSVIAIDRGLRTHGRFLVEYSDEELLHISRLLLPRSHRI
jgi:hypothetical protein